MKISIATSVFVNYTIQETIRHIAEAGYDGMGIWGGRPHVYHRDISQDELRQVRSLLDDYEADYGSCLLKLLASSQSGLDLWV